MIVKKKYRSNSKLMNRILSLMSDFFCWKVTKLPLLISMFTKSWALPY